MTSEERPGVNPMLPGPQARFSEGDTRQVNQERGGSWCTRTWENLAFPQGQHPGGRELAQAQSTTPCIQGRAGPGRRAGSVQAGEGQGHWTRTHTHPVSGHAVGWARAYLQQA